MLAAARNLPLINKHLFSFVLVEYERKMCLNLKVIHTVGRGMKGASRGISGKVKTGERTRLQFPHYGYLVQ